MSLTQLKKCNPNDLYCDVWRDEEYKNDLRKDYCENINCKDNYKRLVNHHINLNKKDCHPKNIMTLCVSCHTTLHNKLLKRQHNLFTYTPKDFVVINRKDHITYINKVTRNKIVIKRLEKE